MGTKLFSVYCFLAVMFVSLVASASGKFEFLCSYKDQSGNQFEVKIIEVMGVRIAELKRSSLNGDFDPVVRPIVRSYTAQHLVFQSGNELSIKIQRRAFSTTSESGRQLPQYLGQVEAPSYLKGLSSPVIVACTAHNQW